MQILPGGILRTAATLQYVKIYFYNAPSDPRYDTDNLQFTDALSVTYSIATQVPLTFSTQHTFRFPSALYLILFFLVLETYALQHDINSRYFKETLLKERYS